MVRIAPGAAVRCCSATPASQQPHLCIVAPLPPRGQSSFGAACTRRRSPNAANRAGGRARLCVSTPGRDDVLADALDGAKAASSLRDAGSKGTVPLYSMSPLDHVAMALFRGALLRELRELSKGHPPKKVVGGFAGAMQLVRRLQAESGSAEQLQESAGRVLQSLLPGWFVAALAAVLRALPSWFTARHASAFTVLAVNWLVGPSEVNDAPPDLTTDDPGPVPPSTAAALLGAPREPSGYRQGVLVHRCRVLEETKCASVCINVCQVPTQRFFNEDVGLPMTMLPDYDTFECQFVFGRSPPPPPEKDIYATPCFKQCSSATRSAKQCDLQPGPEPHLGIRQLSADRGAGRRNGTE